MEWIKYSDFEKMDYEGYCWIVYKGKVVMAHRLRKVFYFNWGANNCFMRECIEYVSIIKKPELPQLTNEC